MSQSSINLISVLLIGLFLAPLAAGAVRPPTRARFFASMTTAVGLVVFALAAALAVWITDTVFDPNVDNIVTSVFRAVPGLDVSADTSDILAYALLLLILTVIFSGVLHLLAQPLIHRVLAPLAKRMAWLLGASHAVARRTVGALWHLPRAAWFVLAFSLLLHGYALLTVNSSLGGYIKASRAYQLVNDVAVEPIMTSGAARRIPDFISATIESTVDCLSTEGRQLLIKVYINGMTVDDAVLSCPDIDNTAIDLVDAETDDYIKAEIIYDWLVENIAYDTDKAAQLQIDAFATDSGAVPAFGERTGVCFDIACLFVAMCRAVDVPVRLITGLGFNGADWLDHSWNEIYDDKTDRWVNVDATFGAPGSDCFDNSDFTDNHSAAEIQGEWPEPDSYLFAG